MMKNGLRIAWIAIILALVLSPAVFAGGGQEEETKAKAGGTVTFMMWGGAGEKQIVEGYLAPFLEENPDIEVEILTPPNYGEGRTSDDGSGR